MKTSILAAALLAVSAGALAAQAPAKPVQTRPTPVTTAPPGKLPVTTAPAKGAPVVQQGAATSTTPAPAKPATAAAKPVAKPATKTVTKTVATAPNGTAPARLLPAPRGAAAATAAAIAAANARARVPGSPKGLDPDVKGAAGASGVPAPAVNAPTPALAPARAPKDTVVPRVVMRESYDYDKAGRRDPFVSLMGSSDLRPVISDLRLTGILFDLSGRRPVAIMRDVTTNAQYRVTTGMTLGRMRVAQIRPRVIVFSIEEFGLNRADSLMLGDTSRERTK